MGLNRDYYEPTKPTHSHAAVAGVAGAAGGLALGSGGVLAYDAVTNSPTGHSHTTINRDIDVKTTIYNERPGYVARPGWAPSYEGGEVEVIETREIDAFGNYKDYQVEEVEYRQEEVEAKYDSVGNLITYEEVDYVQETDDVELDEFGNVVEYQTIEETVRISKFCIANHSLLSSRKTWFRPFELGFLTSALLSSP